MVPLPPQGDASAAGAFSDQGAASASALGSRIALAISLLDETDLPSAIGKSVKQIQRYAQGKSEPPVTAITALAAVAGVRVEWLATGRGPMRDDPAGHMAHAPSPVRTDGRLLSRLTERILAVHKEAGLDLGLRQAVELAAREHDRIVSVLSDSDDRLIGAGEVIAELRRELLIRQSALEHIHERSGE